MADSITFINTGTGVIDNSLWDFGNGKTSIEKKPPVQYYNNVPVNVLYYTVRLIVTDTAGCSDETYQTLKLENMCNMAVPSAFTPNGDGVNDSFKGYGVSIKNYLMNIYNRWGELIYTTDNYERPWDGRLKSEVVQNDVFVYRIVLIDQHDHKHTYLGNVSVIK